MRWLLFILFLTSNNLGFCIAKHEKLIDKVTSNFAKGLKKEKAMSFSGYGGSMMYDVEKVFLSFDKHQKPSLEEARALFVDVAESYLNRVNTQKDLRPYLHNFPFTIQNLELQIAFQNEHNTWHRDGSITFAMYSRRTGHISYAGYNPDTKMLYTICEEPYEEAVRLVKGAVSGL